MKRLVRVSAHAVLIFIVMASLSPPAARPTVGLIGFLEHMAAYALCAFLYGTGYREFRAGYILCALAVLAPLLEIAQANIPGRGASAIDAAFSVAGAAIGLAFAQNLKWIRRPARLVKRAQQ